jgi:hypothetical protein
VQDGLIRLPQQLRQPSAITDIVAIARRFEQVVARVSMVYADGSSLVVVPPARDDTITVPSF